MLIIKCDDYLANSIWLKKIKKYTDEKQNKLFITLTYTDRSLQ